MFYPMRGGFDKAKPDFRKALTRGAAIVRNQGERMTDTKEEGGGWFDLPVRVTGNARTIHESWSYQSQ